MDHLDIETAHRLLRGQLEADAQVRWLRHTDTCQRCRDLLADERAMMAVLALGEDHAREPALEPGPLLDRVPMLNPRGSARRRTSAALLVADTLLVIGLAALLAWQVQRWPASRAALASELRIAPVTQQKVVANLTGLTALRHNPWLPDQYETIETLETLITGRKR